MGNIIGHHRQREYLRKIITNQDVSHSYLFEGIAGIGKKALALEFSKGLLCKSHGERPCDECSSCKKFGSSNHPDFKLVEPDKGIIRKSQIDEIVDQVKTSPFESDRKLVVMDDAHLMNVESMNGLLKTLEEPPEFLIIILISHDSFRLLPTIKSRCQSIKFSPIKEDRIREYIVEEGIVPENQAGFISKLALGSIGLAKEIGLDEDLLEVRDGLIYVIGSLIEGKKRHSYRGTSLLMENKEKINILLDFMVYWFRDLAIYKETSSKDLFINQDKMDEISRQSINLEIHRINDIIEFVAKTRRNIEANVNLELSLEMMFLNI